LPFFKKSNDIITNIEVLKFFLSNIKYQDYETSMLKFFTPKGMTNSEQHVTGLIK